MAKKLNKEADDALRKEALDYAVANYETGRSTSLSARRAAMEGYIDGVIAERKRKQQKEKENGN